MLFFCCCFNVIYCCVFVCHDDCSLPTVNLPKPPELLARLFILAGRPHSGRQRGEHVLMCMKALCPNMKEELVELWDMVVPKLLSYLHGNS